MYPKYEPEKWNNNIYIKKSHNCYAYALNIISTKLINICKTKINFNCPRPQPNMPLGHHDISSCKLIESRMLKDNPKIKKILNPSLCPKNYYLIALACTKDKSDYHFYRQDQYKNGDKLWSHKNGWRKATNKDNSNKLIIDPKYADRGNFEIFCGYYIVPINSKKYLIS
jgi:hypothetical protein